MNNNNKRKLQPFVIISVVLFQANNWVIWSAVKEYNKNREEERNDDAYPKTSKPHIVTSNLEHDSIKLVLENLEAESCAGNCIWPGCRSVYN